MLGAAMVSNDLSKITKGSIDLRLQQQYRLLVQSFVVAPVPHSSMEESSVCKGFQPDLPYLDVRVR